MSEEQNVPQIVELSKEEKSRILKGVIAEEEVWLRKALEEGYSQLGAWGNTEVTNPLTAEQLAQKIEEERATTSYKD
ncbi:hypothetical protein COV24_03095 [candidate division WWE3 bacterium CG10_big_fil_rev_8_21_14_0_10_32_10]|uniref:Uncharacterized protein n=1 Tax=candidate division WWE3 bacterium CG10_big_fil_rev_8_21_14_0_10_32_10 TaxID=1975090 RepID=A0A2H0RAM9_UNCKA|nr:MAG: hypothetical protein COV24_03095 [candidate division WWE3 bacterium CG10_big_fil_rev_8_21_14_0_10_32_10]